MQDAQFDQDSKVWLDGKPGGGYLAGPYIVITRKIGEEQVIYKLKDEESRTYPKWVPEEKLVPFREQ